MDHLALLQRSWPALHRFCHEVGGLEAESLLPLLWLFLVPLGRSLSALQSKEQRPVVQGILGPPGTGKSVAAEMLALILRELGHRPVVLSIDDLYFSRSKLEIELARHPILMWRGPPGTHDVDLGIEFFDSVRSGAAEVDVPRFDKTLHNGLGDRGRFERVVEPDLVIFEGWIVGLMKQQEKLILDWLRAHDARSVDLALKANESLEAYAGLWAFLDRLMLLHVPDVSLIRRWRLEAERARREAGLGAMTESEVERFVDYLLSAIPPPVHYWPLIEDRRGIDMAVAVDPMRRWSVAPGGTGPASRVRET
jgi:D-glycerate 3-kinase